MNMQFILLVIGIAIVSLLAGYFLRSSALHRTSHSAEADAGVAACHALVDDFASYPLVYAGNDFEGMPLKLCEHRHTDATNYGVPATDQVIFIYGSCTPSADDEASCVPPLQIHVYPACMPIPLDTGSGTGVNARGLTASYLGSGSLFANATAYHVKMSAAVGDDATNRSAVARAMSALRGANTAAAAITSESPLSLAGQGAAMVQPGLCN